MYIIPIVFMPDRLLLRCVLPGFWTPNLKALPGDVVLKPGEVAEMMGKPSALFWRENERCEVWDPNKNDGKDKMT